MCARRGDDIEASRAGRCDIRLGGVGDVPVVARLHAGQISEGFLASLGPRFLERLYRRMCRSEGSFVLVADDGGRVVGFVAGSVATRQLFSTFVVRDGPFAALRSPGQLLSSWRRVRETLRHGRAGDEQRAEGELLAIAVDPRCRRGGVGARLVQALLEETARRSAASVDVVVGAGNQAAIALYRHAGFVPVRHFELHPGTTSLVLRHSSPPGNQAAGPG